jgi:hypothetical protein
MEMHSDPETGDIVFSGRVSRRTMAELPLDDFDMALLRDCTPSEKGGTDAADWLLALEMLFRKARSLKPVRA